MDYKKLNKVAEKLEAKYIQESAKGNEEAKEILAITQAYRILSAKAEPTKESSGLHLQRVSNNESEAKVVVCDCPLSHRQYPDEWSNREYCLRCGHVF